MAAQSAGPALLGAMWSPHPPSWEPAALWGMFAFFAAVGLWLCRRQLVVFRGSRMWAVARTEFRRAWRHQLWWLVPAWFLMLLGVGAYLRAPSPLDRLPQAIEQALGTQTVLPVLGLLVWTAAGLPGDRRSGVLMLNLTKPATALEQVAGRALGVGGIAVLLVACFYVLSLAYLNWQGSMLLADATEQLARQEAAYAADPSVVNFPNPNLKRVVNEGALVSFREVLAEQGAPGGGDEPPPSDRDALAARDQRLDLRMHVGAVESGTYNLMWLRGGTRERAVFQFPELVYVPGNSPRLLIHVACMYVEPGAGLPTLAPTQDGKPLDPTDVQVELELRTARGKGYKRLTATLDPAGAAALPVELDWGIVSNVSRRPPRSGAAGMEAEYEVFRYGAVTISLICATKKQIAVGVGDGSVRFAGLAKVTGEGADLRIEPLSPRQILDDPYVTLQEVEGSSWVRAEGRTDADGDFVPSSEIAWFDFAPLDMSGFKPAEKVPLRITCRAQARRNLRDPVTGELLPTEGRVIVVPHDRAYGPVGQLPASVFQAKFTASQVGDHWIYVDRDAVGAGAFRVFVQCITDGHAIGLTDDAVAVVLGREPFGVNLLRAELTVLIHLFSVIGLASLGASLLNRSLAIVGSSCWYLFGFVAGMVAYTIFFEPYFGREGATAFSLVLRLFPPYGQINASALIAQSRSIDWATVGGNLQAVAGYGLCHILLAGAILDRREVG